MRTTHKSHYDEPSESEKNQSIREIREKIEGLGYIVHDGNYKSKKFDVFLGLIMKNAGDEDAIADIRYFEELVVIPAKDGQIIDKDASELTRKLEKSGIPFRLFAREKQ